MKAAVRIVMCCAAVLLFSSAAAAQKGGAAWGLPQVFSSLSYGMESGDVGGMEVILIPGDGVFWAAVTIAEGVPRDPVLVKADVKGSDVSFTLAGEGAYAGKFKGKISAAGLRLWWPSGEQLGLLKRQRCR